MVPGRAYRLLGSDCPIVVSRDLLHYHMISCLLVLCCLVVSRRSPQPSFDAWGCTSTLLCYLIDWLMYVRVAIWSWVLSVGGWLIDAFLIGPLHGTLYPMTDLYHTRYDWLSCSATTPLLIVTVLGSRYYSYWFLNCFIPRPSYYLRYLGHSIMVSRRYITGRCGL